MGAWIYHNHINISDKPLTYDMGAYIYYKDIDEKFIDEVAGNPIIQCIQINGMYGSFSEEVYSVIDKILEKRENLAFRIYSVMGDKTFDICPLIDMKHLHHLIIDCHLRENQNLIDFDVLTKLHLKSLCLNAFDKSDFVTLIENQDVGFEVFDNEIIVFYFTDHTHFEDYSSDLNEGDPDYVQRAKEFLKQLFTLPIRKYDIFKGKKLSCDKYYFVLSDGTEDFIGGTLYKLCRFLNPFRKKRTEITTWQYDTDKK